jgi:iron-sulfur cluster assembly accessory protein
MVMVTKTNVNDLTAQPSPQPPTVSPHDSSSAAAAATQEEGIIITDACWKQILRLATRKKVSPSDIFLRMYVDAGGCSGFEYKFEVETDTTTLEDDDRIWVGPDGARVVVDESSLEFVKGATLDYVEEMIKSAFTVKDNPLSEAACGCGSSFAVKNFSANPALD